MMSPKCFKELSLRRLLTKVAATLPPLMLACMAATPTRAGNLLTTWLTHDGEAVVELRRCDGNKLCGRVVWLKDPVDGNGVPLKDAANPDPSLRARRICGLDVLTGLVEDRAGGWDGGKIYDPEEGRTYDAALKEAGPEKIVVTGYLGLRAMGEDMTWEKQTLTPSQRCDSRSPSSPRG